MKIFITIKPGAYRNMVKSALEKDGFNITGSGYMLPTDEADLECEVPTIDPEDFWPASTQGKDR